MIISHKNPPENTDTGSVSRMGWLTDNKFEQDGTHAPQIGFGIVFVELQNLRGHVQGRPAQGLCQALWLQASCKAEICNLQQRARFGRGQQEVLRLQVPLRASRALCDAQ